MPKIREVVLDVDLTCHRCSSKIKKVIAKHKEKLGIQTVTYDEKSGEVIVAGPFDPEEVVRKLCREACEVIKRWCIKKPEAEKAPKTTPDTKSPPAELEPATSKPPPTDKPPASSPDPVTVKCGPTYYPCPYPYPYPYPCPYPVPLCSCGGRCGGRQPCACGCGGGCSRPYHPLPLASGWPYHWVCEEEAPGPGCLAMYITIPVFKSRSKGRNPIKPGSGEWGLAR